MKLIPETREDVTIEWLSKKVFQEEQYEIQQVEWKGSVGKGLGMLSSMERLTITYRLPGTSSEQSLNLIMKTLPKEMGTRQFMLKEGLAQREFQMYAKVFPAWKSFMDNQNVPQESRFRHPHCYYKAESGEGLQYRMILLLEDLDKNEFSMWTPGFTKAMGQHETKAVLTQLALFHAVGIAYQAAALQENETYPQKFAFIGKQPVNKEVVVGFLKNGAEMAIKQIVDVDEENAPEGLKDDLQQLGTLEQVQRLPIALHSPKHSTILHHDLHANNIMFKDASVGHHHHQSGEKDAVLFDFQCCEYSNPMKDVTFFLFLSCNSRYFLEKKKLTQLLSFYHNVFHKALQQMASPVEYTLQEIKSDFEKFSALTIIHILMGSLSWCFGDKTSENTKMRLKAALYHTYYRTGSFTNCFKPIHLRPSLSLTQPRAFLLSKQEQFIIAHSRQQAMFRENSKDHCKRTKTLLTLNFQSCPNRNLTKASEGPILIFILSHLYQCFLLRDRLQILCRKSIMNVLSQVESTVDHFVQQIKNFWESPAVTLVLIILGFLSWCVGSNIIIIVSRREIRLLIAANYQNSLIQTKGLLPVTAMIYNEPVGSIYQRLTGREFRTNLNNRDSSRFNDETCETPMLRSLPSAG